MTLVVVDAEGIVILQQLPLLIMIVVVVLVVLVVKRSRRYL